MTAYYPYRDWPFQRELKELKRLAEDMKKQRIYKEPINTEIALKIADIITEGPIAEKLDYLSDYYEEVFGS